jgi:hypothetical protein
VRPQTGDGEVKMGGRFRQRLIAIVAQRRDLLLGVDRPQDVAVVARAINRRTLVAPETVPERRPLHYLNLPRRHRGRTGASPSLSVS